MFLCGGTGCLVYLVGNLNSMPVIQKNRSTDMLVMVKRKRYCFDECRDKVEHYRVILNYYDAVRIMKFGYLGMMISIRGDLRVKIKAEIIAEKIDFTSFPGEAERDVIIHSREEKSDIKKTINNEVFFERDDITKNYFNNFN